MKPRAALLSWTALLLALVLPAGCGKQASPVAPEANVPPAVVTLFPLPRATLVPYFTQIYAQFGHALDPRSVDTTSVYLKLDTRRLAVSVDYIRLLNRIQITPRADLELNRTYTVEILARVRTPEGDSLGRKLSWQFTTNSLRRLHPLTPPEGALEGPHALLTWGGGNDGSTGQLSYEVYAGTDSAAVASRETPMLQNGPWATYLPRASWPSGSTVYWTATAVQLSTGERLDGPVSSFHVYPADTPIDSMEVTMQDFGGAAAGSALQFCTQTTVRTGPAANCGIRWGLNGNFSNWRVADARVQMFANPLSANGAGLNTTQLWYAQNTWVNCSFTAGGAPYTESNGYLATGSAQGLFVTFRSPALAAFFEAQARYGGWHGVLMRTAVNTIWDVNSFTVPRPTLMVYFYRPAAPTSTAR